MENKDIRLKDLDGNYLYPLAHADDKNRVIEDTYLNKIDESYLKNATVESKEDPETGILITTLELTKGDGEVVKFLGGDGGVSIWGQIKGDLNDQLDLVSNFEEINFIARGKNRLFRQANVPEDTSEYSLQEGDMWYNIGYEPGYTYGKWYIYSYNPVTGEWYWADATDEQVKENSSKISISDEKIATEVEERKLGEAKAYSKIEQTAHSIRSEVGIDRVRWLEPLDQPPFPSSEYMVQKGDLWLCQDESSGWEEGKWYIYKDGESGLYWYLATPEELETINSKIEQTADGLDIEITRAKGEEETLTNNLKITADGLTEEITRASEAEGVLTNNLKITADGLEEEISNRKESEDGLVEDYTSKITATATEIRTEVSAVNEKVTEQGTTLSEHGTAITENANAISLEATSRETADGELQRDYSSKIKVEADRITQEVTDRTNGDNTLSTKIETTAEGLTLNIQGVDNKYNTTKATVDGWSISGPSGTTLINGGKIKADTIEANVIKANTLTGAVWNQIVSMSSSDSADNMYTKHLLVGTNPSDNPAITISEGGPSSGRSVELTPNGVSVNNGTEVPWSVIIAGGGEPDQYIKSASVSGNTLTLTKKDGSTVTFTKSATAVFG